MDLRLAWLITLSACSTGMSDIFAPGEEFVGLPAALLETGAPAEELTIAGALTAAARWLRTATRADLLARIAASTLSPAGRARVQVALDRALRQEAARMTDATGLIVAEEIFSRPDHRPFASPHYWAAFAAWGAVVEWRHRSKRWPGVIATKGEPLDATPGLPGAGSTRVAAAPGRHAHGPDEGFCAIR